jgi:hypothetical protein
MKSTSNTPSSNQGKPFGDESSSWSIGGLTVENDADKVTLYGNLEIHRDRNGLANARLLRDIAQAMIDGLGPESALPETAQEPPAGPTGTVHNPFE